MWWWYCGGGGGGGVDDDDDDDNYDNVRVQEPDSGIGKPRLGLPMPAGQRSSAAAWLPTPPPQDSTQPRAQLSTR